MYLGDNFEVEWDNFKVEWEFLFGFVNQVERRTGHTNPDWKKKKSFIVWLYI